MSEYTCADCSTPYRAEQSACPHCGSTAYTEGDVVISKRLPLLVSVSCDCGLGPWQIRLPVVVTGLVQLPELHCASCGRRVQIPWPPAEEDMPKINRRGNHSVASNARDTGTSPAVDASKPLAVAEDGQGRPLPEAEPAEETVLAPEGESAEPEPMQDLSGLTLAELRALADERGVPSYGTKAQITERLTEDAL